MPANSSDKRLTIRFTQEEYAFLKEKSGDKPLSSFLRSLSLEQAETKRKSAKSAPVKDHVALAQILALLGKAGIFAGLDGLNKASQLGLVDLDKDAKGEVKQACVDIAEIKSLLMRSLGISEQ